MPTLDDRMIRSAFAKLGERLLLDRDVEILIVGGAAGVLSGELPPSWTTADVDLIHCSLPGDRDAVLASAAEVGRELSPPGSLLTDDVGLYAWTLLDDWQSRRLVVGAFG